MSGTKSGLLWAGGLLVAVAGLYVYGLVAYEPQTFQVIWSTEGDNQVEQWTLEEGAAARFSFTVPARNLTTVAASVAWTDDVGQPDRLSLNVTGPFGDDGATETRRVTGNMSPLSIEVAFLPIPHVTTVQGGDEHEAFERLGHDHAPWNGLANVTIVVWLQEAKGTQGTLGGIGAEADSGNDVRVSMSFTQYRANLVRQG